MRDGGGYSVVLGVIGADCHAVGNKILNAFLTENGIEVINLGVMVSQDEFILAAKEHQADAILVSSIYGHGEIDCQGFRKNCERQQLYDVVLYVGGNLVIGKQQFADVVVLFKAMGFDRVFPPTANLGEMVDQLKQDIDSSRRGMLGHNYRAGPETYLDDAAGKPL